MGRWLGKIFGAFYEWRTELRVELGAEGTIDWGTEGTTDWGTEWETK